MCGQTETNNKDDEEPYQPNDDKSDPRRGMPSKDKDTKCVQGNDLSYEIAQV